MDLEKKPESPSFLQEIRDILDTIGDGIGLVASPSTLWLLVLYNSCGRGGFDGYVTNASKGQPTSQADAKGTSIGTYRGWEIFRFEIGKDEYFAINTSTKEVSPHMPFMEIYNWIDTHTPTEPGTPTQPTEPINEVYTIVYRGYSISYTNGLYLLSIPERHIASTFTTLAGVQTFIDNLLLISV
jgi:hypothetical protein